LDNFVNISSALEALPPDPFASRRLGIRSRSCLLLLYTITTFYKATVLVIKPFIDVKIEHTATLFLFILCTFSWLERKNTFCTALGAGYSYATDCGWL